LHRGGRLTEGELESPLKPLKYRCGGKKEKETMGLAWEQKRKSIGGDDQRTATSWKNPRKLESAGEFIRKPFHPGIRERAIQIRSANSERKIISLRETSCLRAGGKNTGKSAGGWE